MKKFLSLVFVNCFLCYSQDSSFTPTEIETHKPNGVYYLNERREVAKTESPLALSPIWSEVDDRPRFESYSAYKEETVYSTNSDGTKTAKYDNYIAGIDNQERLYKQNYNRSDFEDISFFLISLFVCYLIYKGIRKYTKPASKSNRNLLSESERFHLNMTVLYESLIKSALSECETEALVPFAIKNAIISGKKVAEEDCFKLAKEFQLTSSEVMFVINNSAKEIYNKYLEPNPNFEKVFN